MTNDLKLSYSNNLLKRIIQFEDERNNIFKKIFQIEEERKLGKNSFI